MNLRYGKADENVLKRSVEDVILHESQKRREEKETAGRMGAFESPAGSLSAGSGPAVYAGYPGKPEETGGKEACVCAVTLGKKSVGKLAVVRAVNRLAAEGSRARSFRPMILLPPGTREEILRQIMKEICSEAIPLGLEILEGQIEVTDAVTRPVAGGTAFGEPFRNFPGSPERGKEGFSCLFESKEPGICSKTCWGETVETGLPEIVAAGRIGLEGTYILAADYRDRLRKAFSSSLLSRMEGLGDHLCVLEAAEIAVREGAVAMAGLSDGGFLAGLWELSKRAGYGLEIDLKRVPILQETIEITEVFGIDPYSMKSEGCLLAAAADGDRLISHLEEAGIEAVKIGRMTHTKEKILWKSGEVRHLDRPQTDSLAKWAYRDQYDRTSGGAALNAYRKSL